MFRAVRIGLTRGGNGASRQSFGSGQVAHPGSRKVSRGIHAAAHHTLAISRGKLDVSCPAISSIVGEVESDDGLDLCGDRFSRLIRRPELPL